MSTPHHVDPLAYAMGKGPTNTRSVRTQLFQFAGFCTVLSLGLWAALGLLGADIDNGAPALVFSLAASGPSLAAVAMWLRHRSDRIPGRTRPSWHWPVLAILLGAAAPLTTAAVLNAAHLGRIPDHAASVTASVGGPLGAIAYTLISGPLSEEFGWRGYVQPRLRLRLGPIPTTLVIAMAWGLWHLPLFFLNGTGQHDMGLVSTKGFLFFVSLFPLSFILLFVSERLRGGVPAAILFHGAWNASDAMVPEYHAAGAYLQTLIMIAIAIAAHTYWKKHPDPSIWSAQLG